jgi:hypothetical protein
MPCSACWAPAAKAAHTAIATAAIHLLICMLSVVLTALISQP